MKRSRATASNNSFNRFVDDSDQGGVAISVDGGDGDPKGSRKGKVRGFLKLMHKTRLHIGQLVKDTSAKLKQASETDHRVEVSASKKITDAKLAKDFQAVLKEFQKGQRLAAERETAYTPFVPQAVLPSSYVDNEIDVSADKSPEQRALLVESRRYAMEVQHFQVQLYLAIGFGLIFLVMNSNAMPTTDEPVNNNKESIHCLGDSSFSAVKASENFGNV
ncbi:unnamed protein product [Fraxinus pennsylvanica]|uniref:Syntaxin N-terminal domain-containing protein n=1 Tax=Fraxinus pennsylvanica TaxID=56036 RepID=A0AAD2AGQ7_9LAMI|nr:unnamed protein product [Fraxinus pennsylvanica]